MGIILEAVVSPAVSAATQDSIPVIKSLVVGNDSDVVAEDIKIVIRPDPPFANIKMINVKAIGAHEKIRIKNADLVPVDTFLSELKERVVATIMISAEKDNKKLTEKGFGITVLAENEWYGTAFPDMIPSFVTPDDPDILRITGNAARLLETWTGNAAMDRYASSDRSRVKKEVGAIYGAMQQFDIKGAVMPSDWRKGCRISSAERMIERNVGTQLDLTLMMASCAESVGLNPVMIFTKNRMIAGIWTDDTTFPETLQTDASLLTKGIRDGSLMIVDCEGVTSNKRMDIEASETSAKKALLGESEFLFAMDIKCSRGNARPAPPKQKEKMSVEKKDVPAIQKGKDVIAKVPETPVAANELTKREQWEKRLLDLSFNNELLSMKMNDTLLPIMTNNLAALKDALTGTEVKIMGRPAEWDSYILNEAPFEVSKYVGRHEVLIEQEFRNRTLRSPYNEKEVERRLLNIHRISKKDIENCENSLYVVLGALKWYDGTGRAIYAPLIMMPAETVTGENSSIRIKLKDDDPMINRTLIEKLKRTYDADVPADPLPMDRTGVDTEKVFKIVKNSIRTVDGADIVEGAFVGIFRPERYDIWNDLRGHSNALFTNKLTKSLMEGKATWHPEPSDDRKKRMMLVFDADGSQRSIVRNASNYDTFVVRSPPGTGKIRTICNIISDSVYHKRTVLVISEKDIVLRTIKERLDEAGIGRSCFRLHSGNADKKKMLEQFRGVIDRAAPSCVPEFPSKANDAEKMHAALSGPASSLHKMTNCGRTLFDIILHYDGIKNKKAENIEFPGDLVISMDTGSIDRWTSLVNDMITSAKALGHPSDHPLSDTGICEFGDGTKEKITDALDGWIETADEAEEAAALLLTSVKLNGKICDAGALASVLLSLNNIPNDVRKSDYVSAINDKIRELLASVRRSFEILNGMRKKLDMDNADKNIEVLEDLYARMSTAFEAIRGIYLPDVREDVLEHYISDIKDAKDKTILSSTLLKEMRKNWKDSAVALDTKDLMEKWNSVNAKKLLSGPAKKMFLRDISDHLKDRSATFDMLPDMIGTVEGYVSTSGLLRKILTSLDVLGGGTYSPIRNDCDALEKIYDTVSSRLDSLNLYGDADEICRLFRNYNVEKNASRYLAISKELSQRRRSVSNLLVTDISKTAKSDDAKGWKELSERWKKNIDKFEEIASWNRCRNALAKEGIGCVADAYVKGMRHDTAMTSFTVSLFRYLRDAYISRDPSLSSFSSKAYDENASKFREMMSDLVHVSRAELGASVSSRVHELFESSPEMNVLRTAIATSGRGMTIKGLLGNIRNISSVVSPCMLMSPPAVSRYLAHEMTFDVVIVDASQMPSYRAVDAIARGKCAVIIGDDKQLPPVAGDNDIESIMDDCLAVQIPCVDTKWNYRSEDLVGFGNSRIYKTRMNTFPAAKKGSSKISVSYVTGRYDRNSRQNEAEAESVVKEVLKIIKERKERSVGIVAFSEGQRDIINGMLSKESKGDPQIASILNSKDGLFAGYVNDVQGYERDIIVLSLGIGKDASGKLSADLSPFSKANGERRLNAALMCARREVLIFSSVRPSDLTVNEETAEGVKVLKELLGFVNDPAVKKKERSDEIPDQISKALTERKYTVQKDVGTSPATIDIAVADPEHPDRYILGIVLDNGPFMRSDATDTEFIFRNALVQNGWSLHRVWTTDWLNNKDREIDIISDAIEKRKNDPERWAARPAKQRKVDVKVVTKTPAAETKVTKRPVRKQYVKADLEEKTMSLEALFSNSSKKMIERDIRSVVSIESPVADTVVAQRLADAYGMRSGRLIDHFITMTGNMDLHSSITPWETKILWNDPKDISSYDAYRILSGDNIRKVSETSPVEIVNAIIDIIANKPGITAEEIVVSAARIFDSRGVTDEARDIMAMCIEIATDRKFIKRNGNAFSL